MHWKVIAGDTGVIETREAMIPLCKISENRIVLIDSGAVEDPELILAIEQAGLTVAAVLCTHVHPDHIANNGLLVQKFGTRIYAPRADIRAERFVVEPLGAIRMSKNCLTYVPEYPILPVDSGEIVIEGARFEVIDTKGHTEGHVAYVTPDGVCCVGDTLISEEMLKHLKLPFYECVKDAVLSMKTLQETNYPSYVIPHRSIETQDTIKGTIRANLEKEAQLLGILGEVSKQFDPHQDMSPFMRALGIARQELIENALLQDCVKSHLNLLKAEEFVEMI